MDYRAVQKKTAEKLKKAGKAYVLTVPATDGSIDPLTGEEKAGTDAQAFTAYGMELMPSVWEADSAANAEGTNILRTDIKVMLAAVSTTGDELPRPVPEHSFSCGSVALKVLSSTVLKPGEIPLYYEVMCRG